MSRDGKAAPEAETEGRRIHCDRCKIRHSSICEVLSDEELLHLNQIVQAKHFKAGDVILSEEQPIDFFANIVSGVVKLTKILPDGRQQIVGLLFPPDFLGQTYKNYSSVFVEAATNVELCCFPHDKFEEMLEKFPHLKQKLFEATLNELDAAREWMVLLGRKSAEEKVADLLFMIAKRSALVGCGTIKGFVEIPMTRSDMADYLGLTVETVSRQFTSLKSKNIITLIDSNHIDIPDLEALSETAGYGC